ncbi:hypothetical protein DLJ47_19915 [Micromonospora sp. S4605]|nr:hypothetical protein DLJ47_19915 [Micromonospora sp. S4605]
MTAWVGFSAGLGSGVPLHPPTRSRLPVRTSVSRVLCLLICVPQWTAGGSQESRAKAATVFAGHAG